MSVTSGTTTARRAAGTGTRRRRLIGPETYEMIFGTLYTGLATNMLLVIACLPTAFLLVATDIAGTWPALVVTAPLAGPALAAAFAVFGEFSAGGTTTPVRTFARVWRRHLRRGLALGALATGVSVVLVVDIAFFWGRPAGAVVIPVLATLTAGTVVTAFLALTLTPEQPGARLRDLLRAGLFLGARRWYLSAGIVLVLALLASIVTTRPAVGLGFAAAPLLFAAWGAARFALRGPAADPAAA
ncbi:DUF624 domain-containing protein [Myceligenerans pegani]|uniref:DUF624 domain-containing protein n=1 Tax=Myceligenerans pegani TaxID=2776917 RepID=A0ABR9MTM5_9MICO|nr:DUF624 domain-containing protein [Myceligenerans sp. TRM 65318]MBE1874728.1 DUF624 domain-containing protein [Myceligenerans sp. TRM 65318]MBE3016999.1 DUF624 domain-containing protein [Myceligenerans sp. TRM 65318]